jgi:hypothetical protein
LDARPSPRWEDNIKMNLKEIAWKDLGWICLEQYTAEHDNERSVSIKGGGILTIKRTISFSN